MCLENSRGIGSPNLYVRPTMATNPQSSAAVIAGETLGRGAHDGNVGSLNCPVPPGTDVTAFSTVIIWYRTFGMPFVAADQISAG